MSPWKQARSNYDKERVNEQNRTLDVLFFALAWVTVVGTGLASLACWFINGPAYALIPPVFVCAILFVILTIGFCVTLVD